MGKEYYAFHIGTCLFDSIINYYMKDMGHAEAVKKAYTSLR